MTTQGSVPFSKKPDKFRDELTRLGLTFPLTWQDIMVTLAPYCTCNGKEQRLTNARRPSDGLLAASQHHLTYQAHDPCWDYIDDVGRLGGDIMLLVCRKQ